MTGMPVYMLLLYNSTNYFLIKLCSISFVQVPRVMILLVIHLMWLGDGDRGHQSLNFQVVGVSPWQPQIDTRLPGLKPDT
jgi:hypothetical protein